MTPENALLERLTDYLTHRMPEPDRLAFEAELSRNPALRQALADERTLRAGIRGAIIRQKFSTIHTRLIQDGTIQPAENLRLSQPELTAADNLTPDTPPVAARVRPLWFGLPRWQVAASFALLGAGLYTYWPKQQSPTRPTVSQQTRPRPTNPAPKTVPAPLAEQGEQLTQNHPKPPSKQAPKPTTDEDSYGYFQRLTAELSIDHQLAQLTTDEPTRGERSDVDELAEGRRLLKAGQSEAAIAVLLPLANSPAGEEWAESAEWYLVGAYLKAGQLAKGKALLQKIAQTPTHTQQAAARQLLKRTK